MRRIIVALLKVDIDAIAPRVFFHNADKLRKEHILGTVRVITQGPKDAVRTIIGHGQQPLDMTITVDIGNHIRDCHTAFIYLTGRSYLKRKETDLTDAVPVISERVIHSGVAHECPHHDFLSL